MFRIKYSKKTLKIKHNNHDINKKTLYLPHCKDSRQFAKIMNVEGFYMEDLQEIKKLGYSFDLYIKQDKTCHYPYAITLDFGV